MQFEEMKNRILQKYQIALDENLVDTDMITINSTINKIPGLITTSTCYGRCIIISKDNVRSKYETKFHLKTHQPDKIREWKFEDVNDLEFKGQLWFLLESPNLHIRCIDISIAKKLHKIALQAKLSKSKFQSIDPSLTVEILGTSSLQIPLGTAGKFLTSSDSWNMITEIATALLKEEQERLHHFEDLLEKI